MPSKFNFLKIKNYLLLKTCSYFIFNEKITKKNFIGDKNLGSLVAPHIVDIDFFFNENNFSEREDFYLVCGDNSRDENLVKKLSEMGVNIYRVTREPKVLAYYNANISQVQVFYQVSPAKLKEFYSKCIAVLIPVLDNIDHCAGQTTLLEGIASHNKIICGSGLSSAIADGYFKILKVDSRDPLVWYKAINELNQTISLDDILSNYKNLKNINNIYLKSLEEKFGKNKNFYVE